MLLMLEMGDKTAVAWTAWWILTFSVSISIMYIIILKYIIVCALISLLYLSAILLLCYL
jgi:hypothetical protein